MNCSKNNNQIKFSIEDLNISPNQDYKTENLSFSFKPISPIRDKTSRKLYQFYYKTKDRQGRGSILSDLIRKKFHNGEITLIVNFNTKTEMPSPFNKKLIDILYKNHWIGLYLN